MSLVYISLFRLSRVFCVASVSYINLYFCWAGNRGTGKEDGIIIGFSR
jgi:hypothetical protein